MLRPTYAQINLENLAHNIDVIKRRLNSGTKYLAVIKANAYGHGIEEIARFSTAHGADYLGVAIAEEGAALRNAGVMAPILILGASPESHMDCIVDNDLMPAVFSVETLKQLQSCAERKHKTAKFHFKIDTGMNRIGFRSEDDFKAALSCLSECPNLHFEGMFTHFAVSELADKRFTLGQAEKFERFVALAKVCGHNPILHASNSGAALDLPALQYDMVRGGISMYGYHPSGVPDPAIDLLPVLSWKTSVVNIKTIQPGEAVSYGLTFVAKRPTVVATLPVGYGDGYKRCLSNQTKVLINGRRMPQIGTICMDQMMVDITDAGSVLPGDEVVLLGTQGKEAITADEMAAWAGTISYEILLSINDRVPRVYDKG